jgi:hypothetical protein
VITGDVVVNGAVAFKKGESVAVRGLFPDSLRPEYKYRVHSSSLQQEFLPREVDLLPFTAPVYPPSQMILVQTKPPKASRTKTVVRVVAGGLTGLWLASIILLAFPLFTGYQSMTTVGEFNNFSGFNGFQYMINPHSWAGGLQGFVMSWVTVVAGLLAIIGLIYMIAKGSKRWLLIALTSLGLVELTVTIVALVKLRGVVIGEEIVSFGIRATLTPYIFVGLATATFLLSLGLLLFMLLKED